MSAEISENYSGDDKMEAAAPQQAVENQSYTEQSSQAEHHVPLSALQSERAHRQQLAEEVQLMKDHLALMESQRNAPREAPKSFYEELPDDDIPTWGEIKKVLSTRERQYQASLGEMKMAQKHPDYAEVITKYLPDIIKENPGLKTTLEQTQDYELAYYLAKKSDRYQIDNHKKQVNSDAQKMVENSSHAGSLSSMGTVSPINAAKRYRDMSDDDFRKEMNKNLGYI